jgi:hypothetical protein
MASQKHNVTAHLWSNINAIQLGKRDELYQGTTVIARFVFPARKVLGDARHEEPGQVLRFIAKVIGPLLQSGLPKPSAAVYCQHSWIPELEKPTTRIWGACTLSYDAYGLTVLLFNKAVFSDEEVAELRTAISIFSDTHKIRGRATGGVKPKGKKADKKKTPPKENKTSKTLPSQKEVEARLKAVSKAFGVSAEDILGMSRKHTHTFPRFVLMYLLKFDFSLSDDQVGGLISEQYHHTSVAYGIGKVENVLSKDPSLAPKLAKIRDLADRPAKSELE